MPRKPSDIVSPNLRIREDLRRRLEKAAKQNDVSVNREMINRLTDSFELKVDRDREALNAQMQTLCARVEQATAGLPNLLAGLITTAEALLAQLDRPIAEWDPQAIAAAAAQVKTTINAIDVHERAATRTRI